MYALKSDVLSILSCHINRVFLFECLVFPFLIFTAVVAAAVATLFKFGQTEEKSNNALRTHTHTLTKNG